MRTETEVLFLVVVDGRQGDISIGNELSLETLEGITDSTVQVQLANGVTLVIVILAFAGYLLLRRLGKVDVAAIGGTNAGPAAH